MADDQLEQLYQKYWDLHSQLLAQGASPIEIAGVLTAQAMVIYKTILSPEEFDLIVDNISDSRDKVKKLTHFETLQ
jgi:hypothetical protein